MLIFVKFVKRKIEIIRSKIGQSEAPFLRVVEQHRHSTHPVKEDVKEKDLSPPLAGNQGW